MIQTSRRSLITGLVSFLAAPAVVRAASLMPVKALRSDVVIETWLEDLIPMQVVFMGSYKFWIMGNDNIVHYEPISNEQFYFQPGDYVGLTPTTL
jgi:hypothetical protein